MEYSTQTSFDFSKFNHLPKKVQKKLKDRIGKSDDFPSLRTLHIGEDLSTYGKQIKILRLPTDVETAWNTYAQRKVDSTWNGPMVNFLFSYSEKNHQFYYKGDPNPPLFELNMQLYCWLNILGPRIIIGLKLLQVDSVNKQLEIAYVEGGLVKGTQQLQFEADGEQSILTHTSYFQGPSSLFNWVLYRPFHNLTVGELHASMAKDLEERLT